MSVIVMAPNIAPSKLEFIRDMILSNELTPSQIANAASCLLISLCELTVALLTY